MARMVMCLHHKHGEQSLALKNTCKKPGVQACAYSPSAKEEAASLGFLASQSTCSQGSLVG